jgi:cytoskeletal protein CcmA (bactofilin family)
VQVSTQSQPSLASQPQAQSNSAIPSSGTTCNGTYSGTFSGNLIVSNGQTCTFTAGGINGNVTLNGGQLLLSNATTSGNVQGSGTVALSAGARVNGNVTLTAGTLSLGTGVSVGGNVTLSGPDTFSIGPSTSVKGNLQINGLSAGTGQDSICGSTVQGNLQFTNNGTAVAIGSPPSSCTGNTIGGNLQVQNNTASTTIDSNTVGGNLQDENNSSLTQVFSNSATGNLQCQNNPSIIVGGNTAKQIQGQCAGTSFVYSSPDLGISFTYPSSAIIVNNDASSTSIQTYFGYDETGASPDDIPGPTLEGFQITINKLPPVQGSFDVKTWLAAQYPGWQPQPTNIQAISIGGRAGYFIAADPEPSGFNTIIVPTSLAVYGITYSTSYFTEQDSAAGQQLINTILSSINFQ